MTSHQDAAVVVAELRAVADRVGASWAFEPLRRASALLEAQAKALSEAAFRYERMQSQMESFRVIALRVTKERYAAEATLAEAMKVIEPFITAGDISHKNNCYFEEFLTDGAVEAARAFTNAAKEKT